MVFVTILGVFVVAFGVVKGYQGLMGVGVYEGIPARAAGADCHPLGARL